MKRDFLTVIDFTSDEIRENLALAVQIKKETALGHSPNVLKGKVGALIFHKPSLRTRCSFEVGLRQLGGSAVTITEKEIELGKRESISDVAKVMSRYFALICIRTFSHKDVEELARHAEVPVVNMLTDSFHPCQLMADMQTILEHKGTVDGLTIAYLGDGNNMTSSWLRMSMRIPMRLRIGTSKDTMPNEAVLKEATACGVSEILVTDDPFEAAANADVLYTDVWASMGQKEKAEEKAASLSRFQINSALVACAKKNVSVMHCLPAERGREITDDVMDGPHSIVFDQAENRLHAQKAVIMKLLGA
jgi:ornithine carbamoyltransferase